jgi:hypothetical protein
VAFVPRAANRLNGQGAEGSAELGTKSAENTGVPRNPACVIRTRRTSRFLPSGSHPVGVSLREPFPRGPLPAATGTLAFSSVKGIHSKFTGN